MLKMDESLLWDYHSAGFIFVPIHGFHQGVCECGKPDCPSPGKHPSVPWNSCVKLDEEQAENFFLANANQAMAIRLDGGVLAVDHDPRNGKNDLDKLNKDLGVNLQDLSKFVVATGGGGLHIFFKINKKLASKLKQYPGIDFKSSGIVICAGSMHVSGSNYESIKGNPLDIDEAPECLVNLLTPKQRNTKSPIDCETEIPELLEYLDDDSSYEYENWIKVGMAIHHNTNGEGFDLWDKWSSRNAKYNPKEMDAKWASFGNSKGEEYTISSIVAMAMERGYMPPVTFDVEEEPEHKEEEIDLLRPPGIAGEIVDWVNSQCQYPIPNIALAGTLNALGNILSLGYQAKINHRTTRTNLLTFSVAGSATGKGDVIKAQQKLESIARVAHMTKGDIISDDDMKQDLVRDQATLLTIDEAGYLLAKVAEAEKGNGSSHLSQFTAVIMQTWSEISGKVGISSKKRQTHLDWLNKQIASSQTKVEENEDATGYHEARAEILSKKRKTLISGFIEKPILTFAGYTTPSKFEPLMTREMAETGFVGRCVFFIENETNPFSNPEYRGDTEVPDKIKNKLIELSATGYMSCDSMPDLYQGDMKTIPVDQSAQEYFSEALRKSVEERAEAAKAFGLEAIYRRENQNAGKLALILGCLDGRVTLEHAKWATAYCYSDANNRARMVKTSDSLENDPIGKKIYTLVESAGKDVTSRFISGKIKTRDKQLIPQALNKLVEKGWLQKIEKKSKSGRRQVFYKKA